MTKAAAYVLGPLLLAIALALALRAGYSIGSSPPAPRDTVVIRYIMGGGGMIRGQLLEGGGAAGDLVEFTGALDSPEIILETTDKKAGFFLPGDRLFMDCAIDGLRLFDCRALPVINRGQ